MSPVVNSRKALEPTLGHDSIEDYEYHQQQQTSGLSTSAGSGSSSSGGLSGKLQRRQSQLMTAKASFNPINSARTSLLNVLSGAKGNKKKGERAGGAGDADNNGGRDLGETPANQVIRNYLMNSSSSSSFISASSTSSNSTNTSRGSGTSAMSKDGILLTPTSSMMASPLSSPELHRQSNGTNSQLASSLGNSMSKPQSTFNRFDEIDIAPYELSDNMISILEKPLGKAAQRAYAMSFNGGKTLQAGGHAQDGAMLSVPSGAGAQTGAVMGGKSGAKHEEFGFCMNQNWRYTSQVSSTNGVIWDSS
jgi:hypothetical protein